MLRRALLLALTALPLAALPLWAKPAPPVRPAVGRAALPGRMAGVYKRSFENGNSSGESYRAEDILEIVPYKPGTAYFSVFL